VRFASGSGSFLRLLRGRSTASFVRGGFALVSLLVFRGELLPFAFVLQFAPLDAGSLGNIRDRHSGLGETLAALVQPDHVARLAALRRIRVLLGARGLLGRRLLRGRLLGCLGHCVRRCTDVRDVDDHCSLLTNRRCLRPSDYLFDWLCANV